MESCQLYAFKAVCVCICVCVHVVHVCQQLFPITAVKEQAVHYCTDIKKSLIKHGNVSLFFCIHNDVNLATC